MKERGSALSRNLAFHEVTDVVGGLLAKAAEETPDVGIAQFVPAGGTFQDQSGMNITIPEGMTGVELKGDPKELSRFLGGPYTRLSQKYYGEHPIDPSQPVVTRIAVNRTKLPGV